MGKKKQMILTPCPFDPERRTHRRPADMPGTDIQWKGCPGPKGKPAQVASDRYRENYEATFN